MPASKPMPSGTRAGRLTVTVDRQPGDREVHCRCDCGTTLTVAVAYFGVSKHSCGCLRREITVAIKFSHGKSNTKIYYIWADMVGRTTRPTHARYSDYGGRGITVCDRWRDFANFYADMGDRPEGRSLDRIDNDRGYSPDNCRWATAVEQRANRRPVRRAETCKAGHAYTEANTALTKTGKRVCRECVNRWAREARLRRAAVAA